MLVEDNIFYAKRNLVDSIWKEAHIEGVTVTFSEMQKLVEGRSVAGLSIDDILIVNNLKHAWQFVFDTIGEPLSLEWVCRLHVKIGEGGVVRYAGDLREVGVGIAGCAWRPEVPDEKQVRNALDEIGRITDGTERALAAFDYLSRSQLFLDGNKRAAQLTANKLLIESGSGILAVPINEKLRFGTLLVEYYESGDPSELNTFLKSDCIDAPNMRTSHAE